MRRDASFSFHFAESGIGRVWFSFIGLSLPLTRREASAINRNDLDNDQQLNPRQSSAY